MIKKGLKIFGLIIGGVFLALLILPFIFEDEIKDGLKQALNEQLNATVDFEDIQLSFIKKFPQANLTIEKLSIIGIEEFQDTTLFQSDKIQLSIKLSSIFNKSTPYEITYASIDQPFINLIKTKKGTANYLITKEGSEKSNFAITLKAYELSSGTLQYRDLNSDIELNIKDVLHKGSGRFTQDIYDLTTATYSQNIGFKRENIPYLINAVIEADAVIEINTLEDKYTFRENEINLNDIDLTIDGYLKFIEENLDMDLTFGAPNADFKNLYSLIPYAYTKDYEDAEIDGQGNINAKILGTLNNDGSQIPTYDIQFNVTEGNIKYPMLPKSINNIFANVNISNSSGNPLDLSIDAPLFKFKMENDNFDGRLKIKGPIANTNIDMAVKSNINFNSWKEALPLVIVQNLEGKANADFTLKTDRSSIENKNWNDVIFNGRAQVVGFRIAGDEIPDISIEKIDVLADPKALDIDAEGVAIEGSDANFNINVQEPLNYLYGGVIKGIAQFQSNKININDFLSKPTSTTEDKSTSIELPLFDFELKGIIKQLLSEEYVIENLEFNSLVSNKEATVKKLTATANGNNVILSGHIENLDSYLMNEKTLTGMFDISSDRLNINDFLSENNSDDSTSIKPMLIPENINITVNASATQVKYDQWKLADARVTGRIADASFKIDDFNSKSLGGILRGSGMYETLPNQNPRINFRVDMSKIGFKDAFKSVETFRYLAPVAEYISGFFNSTLVIDSELDDGFMPVLNTINASGFLETFDGRITGFGPMESLGKKMGIEKLSEWAITNSKNWFEIADGMVELKDNSFDLGNNINLNIGGKHGLGQSMDYHLLFEIPREYLKNNKVTGILEEGLSVLEKQAGALGIDLQQGDYLLVNVNMTGNIANPVFQIKPIGKSDKKLDQMAKDELKKKEEEVKDNLDKVIKEKTSEIKDTVQQIEEKLKDTVANVLEENKQKVKDSLDSVINKKTGGLLDSLKNKVIPDSSKVKVIDISKEKAAKEIEDIKKKLEKWDPLKKKKKKIGG